MGATLVGSSMSAALADDVTKQASNRPQGDIAHSTFKIGMSIAVTFISFMATRLTSQFYYYTLE